MFQSKKNSKAWLAQVGNTRYQQQWCITGSLQTFSDLFISSFPSPSSPYMHAAKDFAARSFSFAITAARLCLLLACFQHPPLEMRREHRFVRVLRGWLTLWKSKILWIFSEPSPSEIIPRNDWGGRHFAENVDKPSSRCLWAVIQRKFEKGTTSAFSRFRAPSSCPSLSSILCCPFPTSHNLGLYFSFFLSSIYRTSWLG